MPRPDAATVHIVDDDEAVRQSLKELFAHAGYNAAAYASAEAFLERSSLSARSCLVLDIRLAGMDGLELQQRLLREGRTIPIVILSAHGDIRKAVQAIQGGAVDFLEKPFDPQALLARVERAVSEADGALNARHAAEHARERVAALSEREQEVLRLVAEGQTSKEIAQTLFVSPRTVETHRTHIMDKLEANSIADLVRIWFEAASAGSTPASQTTSMDTNRQMDASSS